MKKEAIVPERMKANYERYHYAPAIKVGNTVWVSGQVGISDKGEIPASLEEQAHIAFQRLQYVLEAAGASIDDVVELVTYHVDFPNGAQVITSVKDQYMQRNYPAWTGIGVTSLLLPGLLLEIKAVAVIGSGT
jgi:enamine deaminase RidA (YjgF/YER057c/UK114 family)